MKSNVMQSKRKNVGWKLEMHQPTTWMQSWGWRRKGWGE